MYFSFLFDLLDVLFLLGFPQNNQFIIYKEFIIPLAAPFSNAFISVHSIFLLGVNTHFSAPF